MGSNNCRFFTQKDHPAPQKLKFCLKKIVFFNSKRPPSLAKNRNFACKNDKKLTQKMKNHPKKPEVLHEKLKVVLPMVILKKNPDPQLHQFFKTHKTLVLQRFLLYIYIYIFF